MKANLRIVCFLALLASASAEPFRSGQTTPPKTVRPATAAPAKKNQSKEDTSTEDGAIRARAVAFYESRTNGAPQGSKLTATVLSLEAPQPVAGWEGRTRTEGRVKLTTVLHGRASEETRSFEAITENGKIIDFTAK